MTELKRQIIPAVVSQHLEDVVSLRNARSVLLRSPHVELHRLARLDERLHANVDGLAEAGDEGYRMALDELERPDVGLIFAVALLAVLRGDREQIHRLLALADVMPDAPRALTSAMGWASAQYLRGWTGPLLGAAGRWQRWLGLSACVAHGVNPGDALADALAAETSPAMLARAARMVGQIGRTDLLPTLQQYSKKAQGSSEGLAAAWAGVLLGDRGSGLAALRMAALALPVQLEALKLFMLAATPEVARATVRELAARDTQLRTTIRAAGWAGDVDAVPWLIKHMSDDAHARVAGEAFSFITGARLDLLDLEIKGPAPDARGPDDDPTNDDVRLDEDDNLPWPDAARVQIWWDSVGRTSMPAAGVRCLAGAAATSGQCAHVLRHAGQRQRHAAALLLSLMSPGTPLFNIAAPAKRQQRWLAAEA